MTHHSVVFGHGLPLPASARYRRGKSARILRRSESYGTENPLRANFDLLSDFKLIWVVQPSRKNIPLSPKSPNQSLSVRVVPSRRRGGSRSSRTLGWDAADATVSGAAVCVSQGDSIVPDRRLRRRRH